MGPSESLKRINIVLVNPQKGENIGSVCRAMKTMGITNLIITGNNEYDEDRIKALSIHAYDVYQNSKRFKDLKSAIENSIFVVATSRRRGKFRKYFALNPNQLASHINKLGEGEISIVFGPESDGLSDADLSLCHTTVNIPTDDSFPSLNLSHAVQIISYTLYTQLNTIEGFNPIKNSRLLEVSEKISSSLKNINFYKHEEQQEVQRFFHDIFARASLSEKEAKRLEKMFHKIEKLKIHKG